MQCQQRGTKDSLTKFREQEEEKKVFAFSQPTRTTATTKQKAFHLQPKLHSSLSFSFHYRRRLCVLLEMKTVATFVALACVMLTAHAAFSPTKPVWPTQVSSFLFSLKPSTTRT